MGQIARLDDLLRRLLAVAREAELHTSTVNVRAWLHGVCEKFCDQARQAGVELHWDAPDREWRFDSENLERALDNLILNALQHTPRGGSARIAAGVEERTLRVIVADTGPGVPSSVRERIFEPFVTSRADGTGLGLTLVREVVEAHSGEVRYAGDGRGARFEITLPWPES